MFSNAEVAGIINGVLSKPEYRGPIDELGKRITRGQLDKKIDKTMEEIGREH